MRASLATIICQGVPGCGSVCLSTKETTLERADFSLQLLLFETAEKERDIFIIFFLSSLCQLLSPLPRF